MITKTMMMMMTNNNNKKVSSFFFIYISINNISSKKLYKNMQIEISLSLSFSIQQ